MRKFLLSLLMLLPFFMMAQDEELPNSLVVFLTDGTVQEYPLQEWPEITFDGTDMVINCGTTTAVITRDEIDRYEFGVSDSGVETITNDKNVVRRGNEVYLSNLRSGTPISVYTVDGRLVMQAKADASGEACVRLDRLGRGIYLLSVNNFTTKIIKK